MRKRDKIEVFYICNLCNCLVFVFLVFGLCMFKFDEEVENFMRSIKLLIESCSLLQ